MKQGKKVVTPLFINEVATYELVGLEAGKRANPDGYVCVPDHNTMLEISPLTFWASMQPVSNKIKYLPQFGMYVEKI